jgi:hypothetical protein
MKAEKLLQLRHEFHNDGIMFCYCGYMTEEVLFSIGKAIKDKLLIDDVDKPSIRVIFSLFVEQVQNVIRYSNELESKETDEKLIELRYGVLAIGRKETDEKLIELRYGVLAIGRKIMPNGEEKLFVAVGNMVNSEDAVRLQENLTHIQSLDAEGLKRLYKKTMREDTPERRYARTQQRRGSRLHRYRTKIEE